jgi:hypothetical protein
VRSGVLPSIKIDGIRRVRGDDVIALVETHRIAAS